MPIRINLFAESQAQEDLRRRDPVKRAIWAGVILVILVLVWSSYLQVKISAVKGTLANLEHSLGSKTNEYAKVLDGQKLVGEMNGKLAALNQLAAGRFLQANLLDAFQHSPMEGIQINRLRTEQGFEVVADSPPVKTESGKTIPGRPGFAAERVKLYLEARDASSSPGIMQVNKFKDVISQAGYFENLHIGSNNISLKSITPPNFDPNTQKPFVLFSLECNYPERIH